MVLVGHSLGGILAAEVALIPSHRPGSKDVFQHRILGVMAFDTPYLGMHPSVISTGITSLFRSPPAKPIPAPLASPLLNDVDPQGLLLGGSLSQSTSNMSDPTFNPDFRNDFRRPERDKWENAWYFFQKHSQDLASATGNYFKSHLEHGGCLADYPGLRKRYQGIRKLEDVNPTVGQRLPDGKILPRVRFVNFYTASTGRIKESRDGSHLEVEMSNLKVEGGGALNGSTTSVGSTKSASPRLSLEEEVDGQMVLHEIDPMEYDPPPGVTADHGIHTDSSLSTSEPIPHIVDPASVGDQHSDKESDGLPPIPDLPPQPPTFDPTCFKAKDALDLARKEHARRMKAFEKAKKDRERAIKDREKLLKKRQKSADKQAKQAEALTEKQKKFAQKESLKRQATLNQETYDRQLEQVKGTTGSPTQKQKDRKFCMLPKKDPKTGQRDSAWVRVYMDGVDEVTAHTSLFFMSDTYTQLFRDASQRITTWVQDDLAEQRHSGAGEWDDLD